MKTSTEKVQGTDLIVNKHVTAGDNVYCEGCGDYRTAVEGINHTDCCGCYHSFTYVNMTKHVINIQTTYGSLAVHPSGLESRVDRVEDDLFSMTGLSGVRVTEHGNGQVEDFPFDLSIMDRHDYMFLVSGQVVDALPRNGRILAPDTGKTVKRNDKGHVVGVVNLRRRKK